MNTPILNRESKMPDDGWYEVETPGDHLNEEAGVIQRIDGQAVTSIVSRFRGEAAKPNFAGLLIDQDHFSCDTDKPSTALGWAMDLRNRDGRLEAQVDWTGTGRPLVEGKTFKFFSTVYNQGDVEKVGAQKMKNRTFPVIRPLRLDRLALTNDPNNKGGRPISNRDTAATAARSENQNKTTMKSVLTKLGLAEDASEESAVAALAKIMNRASQLDALTAERDSLLSSQVESDLTKYAKVIKNRDAVKKALLANRKDALEFLDGLQEAAPAEVKEEKVRITNRAAAATPAELAATAKAAADSSLAQRIQNRAHVIQKEKSTGRRPYSFPAAFDEARAELTPESK